MSPTHLRISCYIGSYCLRDDSNLRFDNITEFEIAMTVCFKSLTLLNNGIILLCITLYFLLSRSEFREQIALIEFEHLCSERRAVQPHKVLRLPRLRSQVARPGPYPGDDILVR